MQLFKAKWQDSIYYCHQVDESIDTIMLRAINPSPSTHALARALRMNNPIFLQLVCAWNCYDGGEVIIVDLFFDNTQFYVVKE